MALSCVYGIAPIASIAGWPNALIGLTAFSAAMPSPKKPAPIATSFVAGSAIHKRLPTLPIEINHVWLIRATLIAIVGALGGAIYPAFKAAQKDPIDALAYE